MIDKRKRKLLIIECDTPKLKAQGLSFSDDLNRVASTVLQDRVTYLIQTKEKELIPTQFAEAKQKACSYSVIVVIGHSDSNGIRLGENARYTWETFSNWLEPFRPQKLFLMSCQGGKTEVGRMLFKNLDSLKEVYGSPVLLTKPEAMTVAVVALADLLDTDTAIKVFPYAQVISILNKGFIWKMAKDGTDLIEKEFAENILLGLQKAMRTS